MDIGSEGLDLLLDLLDVFVLIAHQLEGVEGSLGKWVYVLTLEVQNDSVLFNFFEHY
jgi:hypothetical protein